MYTYTVCIDVYKYNVYGLSPTSSTMSLNYAVTVTSIYCVWPSPGTTPTAPCWADCAAPDLTSSIGRVGEQTLLIRLSTTAALYSSLPLVLY